jgi:hypothetical protein
MTGKQPAVDPAELAYRAGDYRAARSAAREAVRDESRPAAERERAGRVLRATGVDPWAVAAFLLTGGVIAYLLLRYVL